MLSWERPLALWLGLSIPLIVALYFLRTRFKALTVGSTFIWRRLADRNDGGRRLRRRSLLLLALQLGAASCAILAAAGPILSRDYLAKPGTAFVVDLSASMALPDGQDGAARTAVAAGILAGELAAMDADAPAALFSASYGLRLLAGPGMDRKQLLAAAGSLLAGDTGFREAAVSRDLKAWLAGRDEAWRVVLLSDGGLDLGGALLRDAAGGAFSARIVGSDPGPLCLGGLALSADEAGFTLVNHEDRPVRARVRLERDGVGLADAWLDAAPGRSRASIGVRDGSAAGAYTLTLLSADDGWDEARSRRSGTAAAFPGSVARAVVNAAPKRNVLIVGRPDAFLRASLERDGFELRGSPEFPAGALPGQWDLAVAVGVRAPAGFPADLLSFGPPPEDAPLRAGPEQTGIPAATDDTQPLSRYVDWSSYGAVSSPSFSVAPGSAVTPLAAIGGAVVAAAWEDASGYRRVALAANPAGTAFTLSASWPVFLRNVDDWFILSRGLSQSPSPWNLTAGDESVLRVGQSFEGPGLAVSRSGPRVTLRAPAAGFYPWTDGGARGLAAANPPDSEDSFAPREPAFPDGGQIVLAARRTGRRVDLTWLFSAALLAFLLGEWLLWRGIGSRT